MAARVISPDMYSTAAPVSRAQAIAYDSAAAQHLQLSVDSRVKAGHLADSGSGSAVDAAVAQQENAALAHQNQARTYQRSADYHRSAAQLADTMNSDLDRIEQQAQQRLSATTAPWVWQEIYSTARAEGAATNTRYAGIVQARHGAAMSAITPLKAAINALTGAVSETAGAATALGNPIGNGIPATRPMDNPIGGSDEGAAPNPSYSRGPAPISVSPTPSSSGPAHSPASSSTVAAAPAAAPAQPQQSQQANQPPVGQPQSAAQSPDDDDDVGGDDLGDEDPGVADEMLPLVTGLFGSLASVAMAVPQKLGETVSGLAQQAEQGLESFTQDLGSGDDPEVGDEPEIGEPPHGAPGSGATPGSGGSGGDGSPGNGSAEPPSGHTPASYGTASAVETATETLSAGATQTGDASGAIGGMGMGMMPPMMPMGGAGNGPATHTADGKRKQVIAPKVPNSEPVIGEVGKPETTVELDDIPGTVGLIRTISRSVDG